MTEPRLFSTWKHEKTGNYYMVQSIATNSTNGVDGERGVVYCPLCKEGGHIAETFYRKLEEFMDGRFTEVK